MKRVLLPAILVLMPASLFAQTSAPDGGALRERVALANATLVAQPSTDGAAQVQGRPAAPPPAPAPPAPTSRRRGSMVGYIEDSTVISKLRVRFDSALHDVAPDRAEFFYAKCGCYRDLPTDHPAYDPNAPGPRPGAADDVNFQQVYLQGEYAFSNDVSAFAEIPIRWLQPQSFVPGTGAGFPNQSGLSDLRIGFKYGVVATDEHSVTVQVREYLPTGDAAKGLGTNHSTFEPALLVSAGHDRVDVESQIGIWIPIGGSDPAPTNLEGHFSGKVFFYGVGPSVEVYRKGIVSFAPVVELVGWHVIDGFESVATDASGTNIVNLKIGGRVGWQRNSIYVGYGHALTDATWYDDIVRVEYRYSF